MRLLHGQQDWIYRRLRPAGLQCALAVQLSSFAVQLAGLLLMVVGLFVEHTVLTVAGLTLGAFSPVVIRMVSRTAYAYEHDAEPTRGSVA